MLASAPGFSNGSALVDRAYAFAVEVHSRGNGDTPIDHPVAVGRLLAERGHREEVVAAGLLHDVLEDTDVGAAEIRERFGSQVADLVWVMTEDSSILSYEQRKAEHRARIARHGAEVASIYAADKLAKMRLRHGDDPIPEPKLSHYRATLVELRDAYPELPFLAELDEVLPAANVERERVGRR